jgi:class 3 adenylate cyclase/ubiquinone/menaquinone biosynthesis C-methylase UbiE
LHARTVSVLFTDLVGSTELLVRLGEDAADNVRRQHFGALADVVARHEGEKVKTQGDGLMAVFDSATAAVACAGEMQRVVERDNHRHGRQLAVRIGLSIGEATLDAGDYFGTPVVEAARLCATAEGGQILAKDVVRVLVGSRADQSFAPAELMSLKGLPEPLAVCEVRWHRALGPAEERGDFTNVDHAVAPDTLIQMLDFQRQRPFFGALRRQSYELLAIEPDDRILDLGCGTGDDTQEIAALVGEDGMAVGVDVSSTMITEAQRRAAQSGVRNVEFHVGDAQHLAFDDASFDGVRADRLLQHVPDPARSVGEAVRVARPGRRVVVTDTDWGAYVVAHPDRDLTRRIVDFWCDTRQSGWIGRQLPGIFAKAGLSQVEVRADAGLVTEWNDVWRDNWVQLASRAAEAEVIDADAAARWVAQLEETVASEGFVQTILVFTACGSVPR